MFSRSIFALFLLVISTATLADSVDLNLRDSSVQLQYIAPVGRDSLGSTELHAGLLYTDDNDRLGDLGVLVKGAVGDRASGLTAGVGLKGLLAKIDDRSAAALALGGQVRFALPGSPRVGIVGQVYFSPNIVTYRDADRFVETVARLEYEIIPQASAYLGYRRISFDFTNKTDAVLDAGFHAGVKMSF